MNEIYGGKIQKEFHASAILFFYLVQPGQNKIAWHRSESDFSKQESLKQVLFKNLKHNNKEIIILWRSQAHSLNNAPALRSFITALMEIHNSYQWISNANFNVNWQTIQQLTNSDFDCWRTGKCKMATIMASYFELRKVHFWHTTIQLATLQPNDKNVRFICA